MSNSGTLASNRQNTASQKFNDNISMLISQYLISAFIVPLLLVLNKGSWTKNNTVREQSSASCERRRLAPRLLMQH
jgi:hypothetical protein